VTKNITPVGITYSSKRDGDKSMMVVDSPGTGGSDCPEVDISN